MPSPYHLRKFVENGYYHIFNRGVEKRDIFLEENDYRFFSYLLKSMVTPPDISKHQRRVNFSPTISIVAFCLMPNHFHLLLRQKINLSLDKFMKSLSVAYTMFFNKKYDRVGGLFQGTYKAKLIDTDEYLLHVSRYIHENPHDFGQNIFLYSHSSIREYLDPHPSWIDRELILDLCHHDYRNFLKYSPKIKVEALQGETPQGFTR